MPALGRRASQLNPIHASTHRVELVGGHDGEGRDDQVGGDPHAGLGLLPKVEEPFVDVGVIVVVGKDCVRPSIMSVYLQLLQHPINQTTQPPYARDLVLLALGHNLAAEGHRLLRRHGVGLGDDGNQRHARRDGRHELEVDRLEPVRRDEVQADVDLGLMDGVGPSMTDTEG